MRAAGEESPSLPQAIESEQQIVGGLIMRPDLIPRIAKIVRAGHFVDPAHRAAFSAILTLNREGAPVASDIVAKRLNDSISAGGPFRDRHEVSHYIGETGIAVVTAVHAEYHARQVRNAAGKSRLYQIFADAGEHALNGKTANEVFTDVTSQLDDVRRDLADVGDDEQDSRLIFKQWEAAVLNRERPRMFQCAPSGSRLLDLEIGAGMIATLAGPPSNGKSALAHQLIFDALRQPGQSDLRILIASVEMLPGSILNRQLARLSGIGASYIRHRSYDPDATDRLRSSIAALRRLMPRVEFMAPPFSIERAAERAETFGADIVLLDYLQRFTVGGAPDDARLQINHAMNFCRQMADQGRAVLVISAVNRGGYEQKTAGLASLQESGELEYASDAVYLLSLDRSCEGARRQATLSCHKARDAELGAIEMTFDGSKTSFEAAVGAEPPDELDRDFSEEPQWTK